MIKEVESYLTRNYYQLLTISKKITKNDQLSQDLLHEVILQLYDKNKIVLKTYDDNSIKYYITAIMRINYYSKTSPFYYKIKRERVLMTVDINSCWDISYEQEEFEREEIYQLLEMNYAELDFFKKSLLDMYLTLNSSMKAVSRKTRIPISSISRYIKQIRLEVKTNILDKLNN
jgi:hydroxymethylpyrimidine pyrophosphatase-like HAD family hydrolase